MPYGRACPQTADGTGGLLILFGVFVANLFRRLFDLLIAKRLTDRIEAGIDRARYGDAGTPEFESGWRDEVDRANGVLYRTEELGTLRLHLRDGRIVAAFGSPFGLLWVIVLAVVALYVWLGV